MAKQIEKKRIFLLNVHRPSCTSEEKANESQQNHFMSYKLMILQRDKGK